MVEFLLYRLSSWSYFMTATAHALIGASLALKITNPIIGIPAAILSHFVADLVPHWDTGTNHRKKSVLIWRIQAALDVILGFLLVFLLFRNKVDPAYLYSMVIASQLPDWLKTPSDMFGIKIPPFSWLEDISHKIQSRMQLPWGLVTQIVVVGVILVLVLRSIGVDKTLVTSSILN
ncbi:hypothetical protein A2697_03885 [Candidatus Curtissbacteria bacterium RIFCSPHIGHO2_01_FULL_41_44]|nr:MAG: hypothetical protein A2697_03885 [Candidatus Curtissbacteria bacterium RIFCSPHIGHO2_01_FULL_41_44]OGD94307.1 MAG: hypothetical protein A3C33_03045 [Candidatus Curtissbacteria bacterium RIFCSPHIGHO2_02_FULL_42_58]OGD97781.1 MAG: hypothetical protein A3E71_03555 [Candidatus Curtissbacteria bacterium RIFCSPHIGHO2_12_FULL_42_33]OGE02099.1 MAG: hypothetical protein A3G16_00410 [Candidatus Curtissbacteria bacterium RIFCSPLOWO2_12_FULL_41_16]